MISGDFDEIILLERDVSGHILQAEVVVGFKRE